MLSIISEFIKIMLLNSFFIDKIFDLRIANLCGDGSLGISLRAIGESVLIRSMVKSKNHWISRKCPRLAIFNSTELLNSPMVFFDLPGIPT